MQQSKNLTIYNGITNSSKQASLIKLLKILTWKNMLKV